MMNAQALKDRLQAVARERNLRFNACWKQLLLERFLARLAGSAYTHKLIFKGGFLLSYLIEIGRETKVLSLSYQKALAGAGTNGMDISGDTGVINIDGFSNNIAPNVVFSGTVNRVAPNTCGN